MKLSRRDTLVSLAFAAILAAGVASFLSPRPVAADGARIARFDDDSLVGSARTLSRSQRLPSDPFWSQAWSLRALKLPDVWPSASGAPCAPSWR